MKNIQLSGKSIRINAEESAEEKYILENRFMQFIEETSNYICNASIFLTGNFSDPQISTGTTLRNFFIVQNYRFKE